MPTLTADLMLLLSNDGLTPVTEWRDLAVAGGLLFDLLAADRVAISSDAVTLKDNRPTGLAASDAALRQLAFLHQAPPDQVVETLRAAVSQQANNQMAQEEIARAHRLSKKTVVWQVMRPEERQSLTDRIAAAIVAGETDDDQVRSLIAVLRGVHVGDQLLRMSIREFQAVAGHIVYARHWPGVLMADSLDLARNRITCKAYEQRIVQLTDQLAAHINY
ncbi:GOLPH3/VPS74 family protein [Fodinicola acaciae]|uniref:GOLPH3/VPS74 family protein n=1 Tax=Fodinicola acaciae TaxID=2681555 RepID=UPI0013D01D14|nr:GPP34 family phosphoprotein [Fodinicola acaciae]